MNNDKETVMAKLHKSSKYELMIEMIKETIISHIIKIIVAIDPEEKNLIFLKFKFKGGLFDQIQIYEHQITNKNCLGVFGYVNNESVQYEDIVTDERLTILDLIEILKHLEELTLDPKYGLVKEESI